MPLPSFHIALGALPGGCLSRVVSFRAFCFANVLVDLEAIYRIPLGLYPILHWILVGCGMMGCVIYLFRSLRTNMRESADG